MASHRFGAPIQDEREQTIRRNFKTLGLALAAVFALSTFASSAASATEATFTSGSNWTTLLPSAIGLQVFKIEGKAEEVKCASVSFDAVLGTAQNSITATPTYGTTLEKNKVSEAEATTTGCTVLRAGVTRQAMIHAEGCHYTFTAGGKTDGTVDVTPTGESCEMKITVYFLGEFRPCLEIPNQTPTSSTVSYTNETYITKGVNRWDLKAKSTVAGIKYTRPGLFCKGPEEMEVQDNAEYISEVSTVKGTNTNEELVDVTWDNEN